MAPYVMQIKINNETDTSLRYLGAVFYDGLGDIKTQPSDIDPQSTGNGGTLQKSGGTSGLFGLVAYSCPDPNQMLIIYVTMPAETGTLNHCAVAVAPSNTPIGSQLANDAYSQHLSFMTEGFMNYPFTRDGKSFSLKVTPKVADPYAYNTYSVVEVNLV